MLQMKKEPNGSEPVKKGLTGWHHFQLGNNVAKALEKHNFTIHLKNRQKRGKLITVGNKR